MINQLQNMKIRKNNEFLFMNKEDFIKKYTKKWENSFIFLFFYYIINIR